MASSVVGPEIERLIQLLSLGSKIVKVLDMKDRLFALPGGKRNPAGKEG